MLFVVYKNFTISHYTLCCIELSTVFKLNGHFDRLSGLWAVNRLVGLTNLSDHRLLYSGPLLKVTLN